MQRKLVGFAIVAVALLSVLALAALLAPPRAGTPSRTASPEPPSVGSCGILASAEFIARDCSEMHGAEVVSIWRAGDPQSAVPTFGSCTEAARAYVGSPPAQDAGAYQIEQWSLPLRYRPLVISGPNGTSLAAWSWRLCLVVPIGPAPWQGYSGSVRSMPLNGARSAALRPCLLDNAPDLVIVGCSTPHIGEVVGTQRIPLRDGPVDIPSDGIRQESCVAAAAVLTGAADPTYAGVLRIEVLPQPGARWVAPLSADTGAFYTSDGESDWLICVLESAGNGRLLDSVADIGTGPLPLE